MRKAIMCDSIKDPVMMKKNSRIEMKRARHLVNIFAIKNSSSF